MTNISGIVMKIIFFVVVYQLAYKAMESIIKTSQKL